MYESQPFEFYIDNSSSSINKSKNGMLTTKKINVKFDIFFIFYIISIKKSGQRTKLTFDITFFW